MKAHSNNISLLPNAIRSASEIRTQDLMFVRRAQIPPCHQHRSVLTLRTSVMGATALPPEPQALPTNSSVSLLVGQLS